MRPATKEAIKNGYGVCKGFIHVAASDMKKFKVRLVYLCLQREGIYLTIGKFQVRITRAMLVKTVLF